MYLWVPFAPCPQAKTSPPAVSASSLMSDRGVKPDRTFQKQRQTRHMTAESKLNSPGIAKGVKIKLLFQPVLF
jgi:hypothetical protein